mmetsp:Transcript_39330/g.101752  ORF Transcript_39330/g.101752 Transcript_39330/m.101752 type:complete len:215 (-) Transcript_39330:2018-2662(-)
MRLTSSWFLAGTFCTSTPLSGEGPPPFKLRNTQSAGKSSPRTVATCSTSESKPSLLASSKRFCSCLSSCVSLSERTASRERAPHFARSASRATSTSAAVSLLPLVASIRRLRNLMNVPTSRSSSDFPRRFAASRNACGGSGELLPCCFQPTTMAMSAVCRVVAKSAQASFFSRSHHRLRSAMGSSCWRASAMCTSKDVRRMSETERTFLDLTRS